MLSELGIADYDAFLDSLCQRVTRDNDNPLEDYVFVDLSPGDVGFPITPYDASVVLMFLSGQVDYAYDYNDMDANGDHIVDKADAEAYLECATLAILFDDLEFTIVPHGSARTIDTTFENRSYTTFSYPSYQQSTYTLNLNSLTNQNLNSLISGNDSGQNVKLTIPARSTTYDSRIVRTGSLIPNGNGYTRAYSGTGFIIGPHLIATAAHCVYKRGAGTIGKYINGFNKYRAVFACMNATSGDYFSNNCTALTVTRVHVPTIYTTTSNGMTADKYDYALIEVEETLTQYGAFEDMSIVLDDNPNGTAVLSQIPVVTRGLYGENNNFQSVNAELIYFMEHNIEENIPYTDKPYRCGCSPKGVGARSGGVLYLAEDNGYQSDAVIGIIVGKSPDYNREYSTLITRPLLQFYLNNPNTTLD
ncbi:MAG: hypothetical protein K6E36_04665 [Oscillospiraceae bacterium]|nr:hypothetical protein [Oscillospiraceae bacterium]